MNRSSRLASNPNAATGGEGLWQLNSDRQFDRQSQGSGLRSRQSGKSQICGRACLGLSLRRNPKIEIAPRGVPGLLP